MDSTSEGEDISNVSTSKSRKGRSRMGSKCIDDLFKGMTFLITKGNRTNDGRDNSNQTDMETESETETETEETSESQLNKSRLKQKV